MPKVTTAKLITGAQAGRIISFPTDTVPALAVLPSRSELIFALKDRPQTKPLILMAADPKELWPYVRGNMAELQVWQEVAAKLWPGSLTLVLPSSQLVPPALNPTKSNTIGLRVPASKIARTVLAQTGPLATTSANLSGEPPLEKMTAIATAFPQVLVLDLPELETEEKTGSGIPSTVAKWYDRDWQILRQGSVKLF